MDLHDGVECRIEVVTFGFQTVKNLDWEGPTRNCKYRLKREMILILNEL